MKRLFSAIIVVLTAIVCCQCTSNRGATETLYNEFVSAYTSGSISRNSEVRVLFSHDLSDSLLEIIKPADVMKITPAVEGSYTFVDNHTLVFKPSSEMKRNATYTASVDIDKLFEGAKKFQFDFRTRPFAIGGGLKNFNVTDDDQYELVFNLLTADSETAKDVESHINLSMKGDQNWSHAADGQTHQLTFRVKPTKDETLTVSTVEDKAIGSDGKAITTVDLPSAQQFSVVNTRCKVGDSKCIEVTFNKNLDPKQNVNGLIFVDGKKSQPTVEGNKIMLYSDFSDGEQIKIIVNGKLRSRSGSTFGESRSFDLTVATDKPAVEFVGDGTILPQGEKILIPFRAIYMRGVRVAVYKMFSNMMGTVMQRGDIDNTSEICYAGRPIAMTTFFIDDSGMDLSEWHTYAIDLTDQVKLEPGAMYHVELSLDSRLSAWPCDTLRHATRDEMEAEDSRLMDKMCERFDNGSYFYTGLTYESYNWWYDDYYTLRQDPASPFYYDNRTVGKNVLATNIGLTALKGSDNTLSVTAINLPDASPMSGITVEAYSLQQQLIGTASTNGEGVAQISYETRQGQPAYVIARKADDISYLKVTSETSLSTSTFDVSGSVIERGLKGFIYGDRGVWRPGDTLHIAFMLNDKSKTLPADHPVSLKLTNPLGQVTNRITRTEGAMGLYTYTIPTPADAPTGIWNAEINVGGVTFNKNLRIETIKPNRLKIDLDLPKGTLSSGSNNAKLHTEWLNGNVASGLKYDISATIIETTTAWKNWSGYVFDNPTKSFDTSEQNVSKGEVGQQGDASCLINFNTGKTAPGLLKASLVTHVYEPSGEFSVDVMQALIAPYSRFVGIKAPQQPRQSHLDTDKDHVFNVASVDKDGNAIPDVKVKVDIYKVDWYWWWSSSRDDMAGYTSSSYHQPVKTLNVVTDKSGKGEFKLNMSEANWGTYLIMVEDAASGHSAGTLSYFDWPWMSSRRSSDASENATSLTITTDKKEYAPGEKMHISLPSDEGSRAIVSISNGSKILQLNTYQCKKERTEIVIEATEEMTPNIYIGVSLVQPYSQTVNDMPIRLYGLTPVSVTSAKSHITPVISSKDEFQPESQCQVTVSEKDGRPMSYTLAIVDEGLLDLTRFKTPDAWPVFNAREALGVRYWDLYSHVNGAFGGRIEQLFSIGGDEALNNTPKAIVNRFTPMVYFSGPFTLKKGEKKTHKINVPNYNGRVRIMVVAGDGSAYGSAEKSVLVRRPLMLIGTMPRQIGRNDEMTVAATVFASQKLGDVKVSISTSNGLQVVGEKTQSVSFNDAGDQTVQFRVKETGQVGDGTISLVATSSSGKADYTANITVRTVSQPLRKTTTERIDVGGTFDKQISLPGDGDYNMLIGLSANQPLNLIGRISQLIAYPHGCVEQTTSKAFPQLYLSEFSALSKEQQAEVEGNIKYGINRLSSYQTADGGMSYWPGGRQSHAWASAYVLQFLYEAGARGYYVPEDMQRRLKSYVSTQANAWTAKDDAITAAYQLYVLATMQSAELGAMNRMREHAAELPQSANYLLSAAYALSGRTDIGKELLGKATSNKSNWWWFSTDIARLMAQMNIGDTQAEQAAETVRKSLMDDRWLSTSETAFSLIAMSQYYKKNAVGDGLKFSAALDGKTLAEIDSEKYSWNSEQKLGSKQARLAIRNTSKAPMYVTVTAQGVATQSKVEKMSNGLELSIKYTDDNDRPLDPATLSQSTTFKAVVTVHNASGNVQEHVAVTHIVPAGWEILAAQPSGTINYQDVRDDRVLSYIDRLPVNETVTIRVNLSATYAGEYYMPSVRAEAMYDAAISGCTESSACQVK